MKIPFFGKKKKPENAAVIDLGMLKTIDEKNKAIKAAPFQNTNSAPGPASDDFSFLGALASAATETSSSNSQTSVSNTSFSNVPVASSSIDIEKLERLNRRINNVIQRIELIERKIERIEHRVDIKY